MKNVEAPINEADEAAIRRQLVEGEDGDVLHDTGLAVAVIRHMLCVDVYFQCRPAVVAAFTQAPAPILQRVRGGHPRINDLARVGATPWTRGLPATLHLAAISTVPLAHASSVGVKSSNTSANFTQSRCVTLATPT